MSAPNAAGRLDRLPASRFLWACLVLISLGVFWDTYMLYSIGPLSSAFVKAAHQEQLATQIPTALFLGTFIGAVLLGRIADRIGRARAFTLNLAVLAIGACVAALVPVNFLLLLAIFVAGIGTGAEIPLSVTYVQELAPSARRGRLSSLMLAIGFLGGTTGGLIAAAMAEVSGGFRIGLLIAAAGALLTIGLRLWVPESPRWLERRGRHAEAEAVLRRIESAVARGTGAERLPEPAAPPAVPEARAVSTTTLLKPAYLRRTLSAWLIELCQGFGSYGFTTFVPVMLYARGYDLVHAVGYTALIQLSYPVGTLLSSFITDRIPRKWGMAAFYTLNVGVGIGFYFAGTDWLVVLCGFLTSMLIFIDGPLLHTYEAEIYPTELRARGAGTSFSISRLGGFLAPLAASAIIAALGVEAAGPYLIVIAGASWLACALFAALLAVDTSTRSLERLAEPEPVS
ncbi:MFS transporter [Sciscionella sediminilitoris]|uniref:MFS transporter n=1 Tax=Sciscionella sediminilitoris TaxID=1445613 RepID=UPI0004DF9D3E|nr:MFS transporter [Sciscionella sp. SE31]